MEVDKTLVDLRMRSDLVFQVQNRDLVAPAIELRIREGFKVVNGVEARVQQFPLDLQVQLETGVKRHSDSLRVKVAIHVFFFVRFFEKSVENCRVKRVLQSQSSVSLGLGNVETLCRV